LIHSAVVAAAAVTHECNSRDSLDIIIIITVDFLWTWLARARKTCNQNLKTVHLTTFDNGNGKKKVSFYLNIKKKKFERVNTRPVLRGQYKLLLSSQRLFLTDENGAVVSSRSYARNDTGVNERRAPSGIKNKNPTQSQANTNNIWDQRAMDFFL
jgi:hypothetical protein